MRRGRLDRRSRTVCARLGVTTAVTLLVSAGVPAVARPAFLAGLFMVPTALTCLFALFQRERPRSRSLTRWDEALGYLALSLLFEALTDDRSREALASLS